MLQQAQALFSGGVAADTVIHHVESYQFPVQTLIADGGGKGQQLRCYLRVFHANQYSLIVLAHGDIVAQMGLLLNNDLLGGMLCHQRTDHTGE